jgi:alginate O-acetyltransferase complex protein AlgI
VLPYIGSLAASILLVKLVWPFLGIQFALPAATIVLPLGFSYLVARQIDLALKLSWRQAELPPPVDFFIYSLFWPSLAAGPITQVTEMKAGVRSFDEWRTRAPGLVRFSGGVAKKALADLVLYMLVVPKYESVMVYDVNGPILLSFYFGTMLFVYFDFSGYTDMAIGAARLMGVKLPENFNNPLLKPHMRAFWQNWHMSLTNWVKRTVFIPVSMTVRRQNATVGYVAPILATTLALGLWHGVHFVWVLWALHHAIGVMLTDAFLRSGAGLRNYISPGASKILEESGRYLGILFVWAWLMLSYCFTLTTNPAIAVRKYIDLIAVPFT